MKPLPYRPGHHGGRSAAGTAQPKRDSTCITARAFSSHISGQAPPVYRAAAPQPGAAHGIQLKPRVIVPQVPTPPVFSLPQAASIRQIGPPPFKAPLGSAPAQPKAPFPHAGGLGHIRGSQTLPSSLTRGLSTPPARAIVPGSATAHRPLPPHAGSIQRFKNKEGTKVVDYNNNQKIVPLLKRIKEAGWFPEDKNAHIEYWLKQYVATYTKKTFEEGELRDYLTDDIVRENKPITGVFEMSAQELLTTEIGLGRLSSGKQVMPAATTLCFYRTMSLAELAELIGSPRRPVVGEQLPLAQIVARGLGAHLGDYKQAKSFFKGDAPQALLEFKIGNSTQFFSSGKLALPESKKVFTDKVRTSFGGGHAVSKLGEGLHDELPGLKQEKRGVYSVSLSKPATEVFMKQVTSVTVIEIKG